MPVIDVAKLSTWIDNVAKTYERKVGEIAYIFCSDQRILEINRQYLHHDYYTDIITFDNSLTHTINGDIFISLDTVLSNSQLQHTTYQQELHRVIIHGILHLCGVNDKGPGEREIMEAAEDKALNMLNTL